MGAENGAHATTGSFSQHAVARNSKVAQRRFDANIPAELKMPRSVPTNESPELPESALGCLGDKNEKYPQEGSNLQPSASEASPKKPMLTIESRIGDQS
jgi:hypothetical protein